MAVKARDDVTLANITDVANVRRYYLLQASTLAAPAAPTVNPAPSPWVTSEPSYTEGSTNTLYTVDLTVFSDGSFDYSTVSKSSSYEAAKSAYNKAVAAGTAADAAQDTADSKARTFTSTPAPPYAKGDLWRNGNTVYICTTGRASGSYTASDWTLTADKTSENTSADTSKVNGTSSATVIQNIATALANGKPFVQQATPSATAVGQLWFPTNADGRVIGMKVSTATGTGSWQTYLMMAGQILVPGSVGTTEIGEDGVTAANIKASNELWAKIASFASVTTDMLIAGNATITNSMIVNSLTGKSIYGSYIEGGELLIQGTDEAATPTTGTYTDFETATDINVWAVSISSSGISRDSAGKSGYCVKGVSTAAKSNGTYFIRSAINSKYVNTLSAWNLSACPYDGITTVNAWVKSSVADTLTVAWFDFQNAAGDALSISKTVEVTANTWTLVQLVGPTGYRPTLTNNPLLPTFMVLGLKVESTQGATRTLYVDQLTWSNMADTSSAVHVYRDAMGSPCVEVIDYQGTVRAKLAAPSSKAAGLTFYADDAEYTFSADGLSSGGPPASWPAVITSAEPPLGNIVISGTADVAANSWINMPWGSTAADLEGGMTWDGTGFIVPIDGWYDVTGSGVIGTANGSTARRGVGIAIGSSDPGYQRQYLCAGSPGAYTAVSTAALIHLSAGQKVRLCGRHEITGYTVAIGRSAFTISLKRQG